MQVAEQFNRRRLFSCKLRSWGFRCNPKLVASGERFAPMVEKSSSYWQLSSGCVVGIVPSYNPLNVLNWDDAYCDLQQAASFTGNPSLGCGLILAHLGTLNSWNSIGCLTTWPYLNWALFTWPEVAQSAPMSSGECWQRIQPGVVGTWPLRPVAALMPGISGVEFRWLGHP